MSRWLPYIAVICLSAFTVFTPSPFAIAIPDDPDLILSQVDEFLGYEPFATAFQNDDRIELETTECIKSFGCSNAVPSSVIVKTVTSTRALVEQIGSEGKLKSRDQVDQTQWETISGNYLRPKVARTENFGFKVTMKAFHTIACPLVEGLATTSECAEVRLQGVNKMKQIVEHEYVILKTALAIAQVVSYTQIDHAPINRTIQYRITSIKRSAH
jgi:hypothetical protein